MTLKSRDCLKKAVSFLCENLKYRNKIRNAYHFHNYFILTISHSIISSEKLELSFKKTLLFITFNISALSTLYFQSVLNLISSYF
jgi:hypothetical protein